MASSLSAISVGSSFLIIYCCSAGGHGDRVRLRCFFAVVVAIAELLMLQLLPLQAPSGSC